MREAQPVEERHRGIRRRRHIANRWNQRRQCVTKENEGSDAKQQNSGNVEQCGSPTLLLKQLLSFRVNQTEVQEQWREEYERDVLQKRDRQIKIFICTDGRVGVENESRQTQARKVKCKWGATTLFEEDEEANEQVNNSNQVDVELTRR